MNGRRHGQLACGHGGCRASDGHLLARARQPDAGPAQLVADRRGEAGGRRRLAVSDAVTRAGFQPVLLSPVNFESLYQSQRQQAIQQAVEQASGEVPIQ